jgi:hypothetical protein
MAAKTCFRRTLIAVLLCAAVALTAFPAAAGPPVAAPSAAADGGFAAQLTDFLLRLFGLPEPAPAPVDETVLDHKSSPAGPLIDPNGQAPQAPTGNDGRPQRG